MKATITTLLFLMFISSPAYGWKTVVDFENCLNLAEARRTEIDIEKRINHFHKMVSYDVAGDRLRPNIDHFLGMLQEKGLYDGQKTSE